MNKIKVVMVPADGRRPYVTNISNTLENMQNIVGGYIEAVRLPIRVGRSVPVVICNEMGRIYGMPQNKVLPEFVGDVFVCDAGVEDFDSLDDLAARHLLEIFKQRWQAANVPTPARFPTA